MRQITGKAENESFGLYADGQGFGTSHEERTGKAISPEGGIGGLYV